MTGHLRGDTIFVNTGRPQKRTRVIKSTKMLREMDGDETMGSKQITKDFGCSF